MQNMSTDVDKEDIFGEIKAVKVHVTNLYSKLEKFENKLDEFSGKVFEVSNSVIMVNHKIRNNEIRKEQTFKMFSYVSSVVLFILAVGGIYDFVERHVSPKNTTTISQGK